jgi:hypothetical protein
VKMEGHCSWYFPAVVLFHRHLYPVPLADAIVMDNSYSTDVEIPCFKSFINQTSRAKDSVQHEVSRENRKITVTTKTVLFRHPSC